MVPDLDGTFDHDDDRKHQLNVSKDSRIST